MDCADIFPLTAGFPAEGFVVILTPVEMDVVAVYTAGPFEGAVSTMDVERVPSRRLPPPTLTPGSNRPGGRP